MRYKSFAFILFNLFLASVSHAACKVEPIPFGKLSNGEEVTLYQMTNSSGAKLEVIDYGCRIVRIYVPDRNDVMDDVVIGYGDIESFEQGQERFCGAVVGRYGNRINHAGFDLDGKHYNLTPNETLGGVPVHIHGGEKGFDRVMWIGEMLNEKDRSGVRFYRRSTDGEEGYPGNLDCYVTYWWSENNICRIEYLAKTDKPTIVNLSNHTYFNLKGQQGGYVMDHLLKVEADEFFTNNEQFVPKGEAKSVIGTPFDMREPHRVDYAIDTPSKQIVVMHGFSVCWRLRKPIGKFGRAAILWEKRNGRGVEVWTTEPGFLTYTGRGLNEKIIGKDGRPMEKFCAMLLETLHFPDSPNRDDFPSTVLRPNETYYSVTEFRFFCK